MLLLKESYNALAAIVNVAQQTLIEAKKTIHGKWDLSDSSK